MDLFIQTLLTVLSFKYKPGKSVGAMVPDTEITNPISTRMAVVITTACQALFFSDILFGDGSGGASLGMVPNGLAGAGTSPSLQ